jgi:uncharacterized glyoxalase superfamily protein PhnB
MENSNNNSGPQIRHSSPIFFVKDRQETLDYYSRLGFQSDYSMGFVGRGGFEIIVHETKNAAQVTPNYPAHGETALDLFTMVYGVEELYNDLKSKGAIFHGELRVTEYGMKEFSIVDPDGYTLGFGEALND